MPIISGGSGAPRPFLNDLETGIVVNRAGGFASAWEAFDLLEPGVGYGKATVTAANADGLSWATDIQLVLAVAVSDDATTWETVYSPTVSGFTNVALLIPFGVPADPVGSVGAYVVTTPRAIRFQVIIVDQLSGLPYAGASNPSATFTLLYKAS